MRANLLDAFFWPLCAAHRSLTQQPVVLAKTIPSRLCCDVPTYQTIGPDAADACAGVRNISGG